MQTVDRNRMDRLNRERDDRLTVAYLKAHPEITADSRVCWLTVEHKWEADGICAQYIGKRCDCTPIIDANVETKSPYCDNCTWLMRRTGLANPHWEYGDGEREGEMASAKA